MTENFLTDEASDGELLTAMALDNDLSDSAFSIFYNRYLDDLHHYTFRVIGLLDADRFDLVQDTMMKAYRAAATFKEDTEGGAEKIRRRTIAWLGRIATNLHYERFRRQKGIKVESLEKENQETENIEVSSEKISDSRLAWEIRDSEDQILSNLFPNQSTVSLTRKIMREVLEELPEREREVLLATYEEFDFQKPNQHLSQAKIDELTERYKINSKNLKQIRHRAKKYVFDECRKRLQTVQAEARL